MLNYDDYQKIKELKQTHPDHYDLIKKISETTLDCTSIGCHDIRNYAGLVLNYIQLIEMDNPQILENSYFQKVDLNIKNLISLLDNIAQYRYSYNNKEMSVCLLSEIMQNISDGICQQAPQIKLNIIYEPASLADNTYINCHKQHIEVALMEILKNSLESLNETIEPNILIHISSDNTNIQITFLDNGCGIDSVMLPNALNAFTTDKKQHAGLGLATAANTIYQHGGNIIISDVVSNTSTSNCKMLSDINYKTKVTVLLPVELK